MAIDQLINILVTITLIEMMTVIGLGVTFADIGGVARNWSLLVRAAIANYFCVHVATVGLLLLFRAPPMVAAGFLLVAVCPGAARHAYERSLTIFVQHRSAKPHQPGVADRRNRLLFIEPNACRVASEDLRRNGADPRVARN
jgi:Sodium Bile acid symporter family